MNWFLVFLALFFAGLWLYEKYFKDRGSAIFVCPTRQVQLAMVRLAQENGVTPKFRIDTPKVIQRVLMSNGWIFNHVQDQALLEKMGNPKAAFAFVCRDPTESAWKSLDILASMAIKDAELIRDIDPGVSNKKLIGIKFSDGAGRFCIIFRKHFLKMGPRPPKWK